MTSYFVSIETEPVDTTTRGTRYRAYHNGEVIVEKSINADSDAARELVSRGADMDDTLLVYDKRRQSLSMTGRLGNFAGHVITEGENNGPRRIPWVP